MSRLSRRSPYEPWLAASRAWGRAGVSDAEAPALEDASSLTEALADEAATWRQSRSWNAALTERDFTPETDGLATLYETLGCDLERARQRIEMDFTIVAESDAATLAALMLGVLEDDVDLFDRAEAVARLRSAPASRALLGADGQSPLADDGEDRRLFGSVGISPPGLAPPYPSTDEALSAWLSDPVAAARASAPNGSLAVDCLR